MKNILIVINTYSQLIIALQLRSTLLQKDKVSALISDHTHHADKVSERLRQNDFFTNVYYIETNEYNDTSNIKSKLRNQKNLIMGHRKFASIAHKEWDKLIYYNADAATHVLYSTLIRYNPYIKASRFEEGILSYSTDFNMKKYYLMRAFLKLMHKEDLKNVTKEFYCFYPSEYYGNLLPIQIPKISLENEKLKEMLKYIFNLKCLPKDYDYKYIYFSGMYDLEGGDPIGELDVICKLANHVGKENLLVKVHPRDQIKRFLNRGLNVDWNSGIPWEVIQMNYDFQKVVFITALSGSVLFTNLIIDNPSKVYFVFPMCQINGNTYAQKNAKDIERLVNEGVNGRAIEWIDIVSDIQDIR